jgi:hypothetical protein
MKNLAGAMECDKDIRKELEEAGIEIEEADGVNSEVPYGLRGNLGYWTFTRAWYYWIAGTRAGKGIPKKHAESFNHRWRDEVRVAGFAGGTDVKSWLSPHGTIDSYHIDTQQGLNAFARLVRELFSGRTTAA